MELFSYLLPLGSRLPFLSQSRKSSPVSHRVSQKPIPSGLEMRRQACRKPWSCPSYF